MPFFTGRLPLLAVFLLTALPPAALAQTASRPCEEEAAAKRGGWVRGDDAGLGYGQHPLTKQYQSQIATVLDGLAALVVETYPDPVGSQGKHYRNYTVGDVVPGSKDATYELTVNFKGYGRNQSGAITQQTETATWLYIQVNAVRPVNAHFEVPQHFLSPREALDLYTLPPAKVLRTPSPGDADRKKIDASLPPSLEALPTFTYEGAYDSWPVSYNTREVAQTVFITPDNRLPYDPVSIGAFLDLNERLLRELLAGNEDNSDFAYYRTLRDRIPVLRERYARRLGDPAYIGSRSWSESQLGEDEPFVAPEGGYLLCRRSDRYGSAQNNYKPRFIVVAWRWQPEVPYSVRVHEAIKNHLDVQALRALLTTPDS